MMKKTFKTGKNVLKHGIAIIAIGLFGILALGSTATTQPGVVEDAEVVSSVTVSYGVVHDMQNPQEKAYSNLKPYTSFGMVFATSTTRFDENGLEVSSQEGIVMMLLREAHKLGADDILNLRLSENTTWVETTAKVQNSSSSSSSGGTTKEVSIKTKTVTITGSALAIKYNL